MIHGCWIPYRQMPEGFEEWTIFTNNFIFVQLPQQSQYYSLSSPTRLVLFLILFFSKVSCSIFLSHKAFHWIFSHEDLESQVCKLSSAYRIQTFFKIPLFLVHNYKVQGVRAMPTAHATSSKNNPSKRFCRWSGSAIQSSERMGLVLAHNVQTLDSSHSLPYPHPIPGLERFQETLGDKAFSRYQIWEGMRQTSNAFRLSRPQPLLQRVLHAYYHQWDNEA